MSNVCVGMGSYFPEQVLTNAQLEQRCGSFDAKAKGCSLDAWVKRMHGASTRHRSAPGEATSDLAVRAAKRALEDAGRDIRDVDLIVMATITGDERWPQTAAAVQRQLGGRARCLQLNSACSGFIDAMMVANSMMDAGASALALILTAECFTGLFHADDFLPHSVFGDGAGALVLERRSDLTDYGMRCFVTGSDGDLGDYIIAQAGGSKRPITAERLAAGEHYIRLRFSEIGVWALDRFAHCAREAVRRAGLTPADIKCVVPHQASAKLVDRLAHTLELPREMFVLTYPELGNTSSASIPTALERAVQQHRVADGDWILMPAAGSGMAWGAMVYRWFDYRGERASRAAASC